MSSGSQLGLSHHIYIKAYRSMPIFCLKYKIRIHIYSFFNWSCLCTNTSPHDLLTSTKMPMNLLFSWTPERFLQQAVVPSVNTSTVEYFVCSVCCVCVCISVRMGLFKSCSTCMATPHYPYCLLLCPEVGCGSPHWAQSSRWPNMPQDGRQTDRLGEKGAIHSVVIVLGPPYACWCTGPWVVPDCCMRPGEQAADLIFHHTAAPTSGPGEGDLPCLLECLLNWWGAVDAVPNLKYHNF